MLLSLHGKLLCVAGILALPPSLRGAPKGDAFLRMRKSLPAKTQLLVAAE